MVKKVEDKGSSVEINLADYETGANYDVPSLKVTDPDPNQFYFIAARNAQHGCEAGTVGHCKSMGYVESDKECSGLTTDLVLMQIPKVVRDAREHARMVEQNKLTNTFNEVPDGFMQLPGKEHGTKTVGVKS